MRIVYTCPELASSVSSWSSCGKEWTERYKCDASFSTLLFSRTNASPTFPVFGNLRQTPARHVEIALPAGVTYKTGDHLGVVPRNGLDQLRRVLLRFKLDAGLYLTITPHTNASTYLPVNEPVPLLGVLANRVELQDVAALRRLPVRWPRWAPALPAYGIGSL